MSIYTETDRARRKYIYCEEPKTKSELRREHLPKKQREQEDARKIRYARKMRGEVSPAKRFHT